MRALWWPTSLKAQTKLKTRQGKQTAGQQELVAKNHGN